jgi:hypothetical protein
VATPRQAIKKRVMGRAMTAANIDTTGLDPEMYNTLGQEATRRVGASMVQSKNTSPLKGLGDFVNSVGKMFRGGKK